MTSFRWGSATDTGRVRTVNQDNSLVVAGRLFALADGMGGHQGGEVASELALRILSEDLTEYTKGDLCDAVRAANRQVHQSAGKDPELAGMGTTLCALALVTSTDGSERLAMVNVGDSRVYRLRGEDLEQLTEDHSLVASMVREGRITDEEAATHPQRNVLTRALGIDVYVKVDSWELDLVVDDRYLLCSDGLFNEVEESRINASLRRLDDPTDTARELVRLANEGGGRDNITCVVVDVVTGPDTATPASPDRGETDGEVTRSGDTDVHPVVPPPDEATDGADPDVDGPDDDEPDDDLSDDVGAPVDADDGDLDRTAAAPPRRFTWRVLAFGLVLVLLLAATAGAVGWYGRNTYFVAFDADEVVIFKGRPGGFLWFDPTLEERSGIDRRDVPPGLVDEIAAGRDQATLDDARRFVANLEDQVDTTPTPSTTVAQPADAEAGPPP